MEKKVVVIFHAPDFTADIYDQVWEDLREAGLSNPKGLISHVGFTPEEGGMMAVDVWESAEAFAEFGNILLPILQKTGVGVPEPKIIPAHYFYQGKVEMA